MRGPDPFLPGSEGLEAEGLEVKTIWVGIKNRESRGLLESEEGGGVGQKAHPSRETPCFLYSQTITLNEIRAWGSAPQTGSVISGGSLTHSKQHKMRGLLGASRAYYEFEKRRTLSIRTPPKEWCWETPGKDVKEDASKSLPSKQGLGITTMSSL